ncbi:MAG: LysM peptidoglycan-binding domain-containing protein [Caldilineaceae bacterium]
MRGSMIANRNKIFRAWLVRLLLALLLLGAIAPALPVQPALASANESPLAAPAYAIYTIQPGDTLFAIARRSGSTVPALVGLNQLSNPNQIHVGQLILIPAATEDRGSTTNYTIRRGDTLYSLARTYNTTIGVLMWLNNLSNPNQINVGQKLIVPGSGSPSNPAPTRIKFPAGGTSATVTGTISVGQRACYVFGALAGQTATLQITSPGNLANFDFAPADLAVNGGFPFKRLVNEDRTFSQLLPVTGDYVACVATPSGTVSYSLKITIPPVSAGCPSPNKAIRSTDWNSVVNSDPALKHEVIGGKQYVTVIGSPSSVSGYPLLDQVVYGDFDGNCVEEAALPLESGGTAGATGYLVYRAGSPKPHLIASGDGYKLALSVTPGRLVVTTALYAGWEPNCCPSGLTHTTYRLAGDVLTQVSSTTDGFPAMEAPTVEQFYAYLSSHDYASAYAMFSPAFQASHPFPAFKAGYSNTVSFTTEVSGSPAAIDRVQVTIHAVERRAGGGTVNRTYVGTWDLIWGGSGWLLDRGVFHVA